MISRRSFLQGTAALAGTPTPEPTAEWRPCADMPVARSETPAVVHNGLIYTAGGFGADTRADRYDPITDSWEQIASLPVATNHPGIVVWNDQIVVAGGYTSDANAAHAGIWAYNIDRDIWDTIGELPAEMGAFGLVSVGVDLYVIGGALGQLGGEPSAKTWCTSNANLIWRECAPLSVVREHLACVEREGLVYAIGGRAHGQSHDELGGLVERYDPISDVWERLGQLPDPRSGLSGVNSPIGVVVAGGETSTQVFSKVQALEHSDTKWTTLPDLPTAVHGAGLAGVDDSLFVLGGSIAAGKVENVTSTFRLKLGRLPGANA